MEIRKPISSNLSSLLKASLPSNELKKIANKFGVHTNTIINIRDRRKKEPSTKILVEMIIRAINICEVENVKLETRLRLLNEELVKIRNAKQ